MSTIINKREAGRLVRAFTARTMTEQLGEMSTLEAIIASSRGKHNDVALGEMRNLLEAFDEEIAKLERRAGELQEAE